MKKYIFLLTALINFLAVNNVAAQTTEANEGVAFVHDKTFDQALQQAKNEDKMLFIDCYTSWCGPCKMLASKVFPQKKVGEYFNEVFVSMKVDMEKGEGVELKKRFDVKAFPTLLFISNDGKEINRIVGAELDIDKFLKNAKEGIGENSLSAMNERFAKGERDMEFLIDYLEALGRAYDQKKCEEVTALLLEGNEKDMLVKEELYKAFIAYNKCPLSSACLYVMDNKEAFEAKYDKTRLNQTLDFMWMAYPYKFIQKNEDGSCSFDEEGMNAYKAEMKKRKVAKADEICLNVDIALAEAQKDWKKYASLCDKHIKKYGENDMTIFNWVLRINKDCTDPAVKKKAVGWMKKRLDNIAKEKAKEKPLPPGATRAMPMVNFEAQYEKLIKELSDN